MHGLRHAAHVVERIVHTPFQREPNGAMQRSARIRIRIDPKIRKQRLSVFMLLGIWMMGGGMFAYLDTPAMFAELLSIMPDAPHMPVPEWWERFGESDDRRRAGAILFLGSFLIVVVFSLKTSAKEKST